MIGRRCGSGLRGGYELSVVRDSLIISPNSRKYREIKGKYMDLWRDKIFQRDNQKCIICGLNDPAKLNLAHITSTLSFVRVFSEAFGLETAIKLSFRNDNLITLCSTCHKLQHGTISSEYSTAISEKQDDISTIVEKNGSVNDYLKNRRELNDLFEIAKKDGDMRKKEIEALFREIKKERIWENAAQLEIVKGDTTSGEKLTVKEKFLAERKGCRIPTGSHLSESKKGVKCGFKASTCTEELVKCENCGYFFCSYHFHSHKIDPGRDSW